MDWLDDEELILGTLGNGLKSVLIKKNDDEYSIRSITKNGTISEVMCFSKSGILVFVEPEIDSISYIAKDGSPIFLADIPTDLKKQSNLIKKSKGEDFLFAHLEDNAISVWSISKEAVVSKFAILEYLVEGYIACYENHRHNGRDWMLIVSDIGELRSLPISTTSDYLEAIDFNIQLNSDEIISDNLSICPDAVHIVVVVTDLQKKCSTRIIILTMERSGIFSILSSIDMYSLPIEKVGLISCINISLKVSSTPLILAYENTGSRRLIVLQFSQSQYRVIRIIDNFHKQEIKACIVNRNAIWSIDMSGLLRGLVVNKPNH